METLCWNYVLILANITRSNNLFSRLSNHFSHLLSVDLFKLRATSCLINVTQAASKVSMCNLLLNNYSSLFIENDCVNKIIMAAESEFLTLIGFFNCSKSRKCSLKIIKLEQNYREKRKAS